MFAAVYIPDFSLQAALRHEPDLRSRPVALIDSPAIKSAGENSYVAQTAGAAALRSRISNSPARTILLQLTRAARDAGVNMGMTPPQALARCRDLLLKGRSPAQERATNEILMQVAFSFSPRIEATALGVCTMDLRSISAPANHNGSNWEAYARAIIAACIPFHLDVRVGIAQSPDLALHAAHSAQPVQVVMNSAEFMARLPLESMGASPEMLNVLHRWGLRTLGEFTALGKNRLAERLDPEGIELFERASALESRPLRLVTPPETYEETTEFENEIESLEPLLFFLRRFLGQISRRLELAYLVVDELRLKLTLISGATYERTFRIPSPTRHVDTLFRMLYTHLENLRTDSAITALHLSAKPSSPQARQFTLFETCLRDPNQFSETIARVGALLGSDRIGTPALQATHRPDAFCMQPVNFETDNRINQSAVPSCRVGLALRRFRPGLTATVKTEGERPVFLRFTKFAGAIQRADGPWRASGNWWENSSWGRDEWDVETRHGLYRLCREQENWFVEGVYD